MLRIASLATLSLALAAPAFAAPYQAEIKRDDWGIAHVTGHSDADAVFGMIYAQAEDDFNRIELNYLTSLGRRAEAEGEALIFSDLRQRRPATGVLLSRGTCRACAIHTGREGRVSAPSGTLRTLVNRAGPEEKREGIGGERRSRTADLGVMNPSL